MSQDEATISVWLRELQEGEVDAPVQQLWERYFQRLVGLARLKLGNRARRVADEEDVALSVFDSFCRGALEGKFPQLNDRENLWRLLVTITARKVFQLNRRNNSQKRGGGAVLDEAALTQQADDAQLGLTQFLSSEPTPEFAAQAAEECERLLALLPDDELRAIATWKMEGFTNDEIATRLNCAPRSVERRLRRLRSIWDNSDEENV